MSYVLRNEAHRWLSCARMHPVRIGLFDVTSAKNFPEGKSSLFIVPQLLDRTRVG
jgi:hypothetical protein